MVERRDVRHKSVKQRSGSANHVAPGRREKANFHSICGEMVFPDKIGLQALPIMK